MTAQTSMDTLDYTPNCQMRVTLPEHSTLLLDIEKPSPKPERLKVIGSGVYLPDGQTPINLSGYNW